MRDIFLRGFFLAISFSRVQMTSDYQKEFRCYGSSGERSQNDFANPRDGLLGRITLNCTEVEFEFQGNWRVQTNVWPACGNNRARNLFSRCFKPLQLFIELKFASRPGHPKFSYSYQGANKRLVSLFHTANFLLRCIQCSCRDKPTAKPSSFPEHAAATLTEVRCHRQVDWPHRIPRSRRQDR